MILHTKHQGSRTSSFKQDAFLCFPYISLCKTGDPGAGPFQHIIYTKNIEAFQCVFLQSEVLTAH